MIHIDTSSCCAVNSAKGGGGGGWGKGVAMAYENQII